MQNNNCSLTVLIAYGLQWLIGLLLIAFCDPMRSNLTGLFWLEGRWLPAVLYCALCLGLLGFFFVRQSGSLCDGHCTKTGVFGLILLMLGLCTPYSNRIDQQWISSLHLLFCIAGTACYLGSVAWVVIDPYSSLRQKKAAQALLMCAGAALAVFAFSFKISLICEMVFLEGALLTGIVNEKKGEDHSWG